MAYTHTQTQTHTTILWPTCKQNLMTVASVIPELS